MALWGDLEQDQVTPMNRRGRGQGYFRYYNPDGTFHAIVAVDGKLLRNGGDLPITGLPNGFQKDRMIEAVQYGNKLYIATGSGLVQYDGVTAQVVTPYTPNPLEALYIGTNGLAPNPDQFIQDGTATDLQINGVTVNLRKGIVNTESTFTAYSSYPNGSTIEYKFEYKLKSLDTYVLGQDWSTTKTWKFKPNKADEYEVKVSARIQGSTNEVYYYLPSYKVSQYNENESPDVSGINTCNRILLHWDRLILYGDTNKRNMIYISHLKNPAYFPTTNTLTFESDKQEPVTKIVQFRDFLVAFLPGSIQALFGKSPQDYQRVRIHTGVGCVAPETAQVFGNYIAFLAKDGVYILKSVGISEDRANVQRIDQKIRNLIPPYPESGDACAVVYNDQYQITFPKIKTRFRFYQNLGTWTKDESPYFDFCRFYEWKGDLVGQSLSTGEVYQFDETVYDDLGYVYEDRIETKPFDFGAPYNPKKLKEVHVLVSHEKHDTNLGVTVYGDNAELISPDDSYAVVENGSVKWIEDFVPNINSQSGTVFGEWQFGTDPFGEITSQRHKLKLKSGGKYRTCRVTIRHMESKPWALLGLGFVFKLKKP